MNNIFDIDFPLVPRRLGPYRPDRFINSSLLANFPKILPVDVEENDDNYTILSDLPGFEEKDINVNIENNMLSIKVEQESREALNGNEEEKSSRSIVRERYFHKKMERHINLGTRRLDVDSITADLNNGILKVVIPFAEESLPKKIAVTINNDSQTEALEELKKNEASTEPQNADNETLASSNDGSEKSRVSEHLTEEAKNLKKERS